MGVQPTFHELQPNWLRLGGLSPPGSCQCDRLEAAQNWLRGVGVETTVYSRYEHESLPLADPAVKITVNKNRSLTEGSPSIPGTHFRQLQHLNPIRPACLPGRHDENRLALIQRRIGHRGDHNQGCPSVNRPKYSGQFTMFR